MGNNPHPGAGRSYLDAIIEEFASAVRDVRHKVVEEPWFGRATTPETVEMQRETETIYGVENPHERGFYDSLTQPSEKPSERSEPEQERGELER